MCDNCLGTSNQGGDLREDKRSRRTNGNKIHEDPESASDPEPNENVKSAPSIKHKFITAGGRAITTSKEPQMASQLPIQPAPAPSATLAPKRGSVFVKASKLTRASVYDQKGNDEHEIDFYDDVRPVISSTLKKSSRSEHSKPIISLDSDED
jgi:hypothetical protein